MSCLFHLHHTFPVTVRYQTLKKQDPPRSSPHTTTKFPSQKRIKSNPCLHHHHTLEALNLTTKKTIHRYTVSSNEGRRFELVFAMGRGTSVSGRTHASIANPNYSRSSHGLRHPKPSHLQHRTESTPPPPLFVDIATATPSITICCHCHPYPYRQFYIWI